MVTQRKGPPTPQLADEYHAGATTVDLAKMYKMSPAAVNKRLRRAGVKIRGSNSTRKTWYQKDPAFVREICDGYRSGKTSISLAAAHNIGRTTVIRMLAIGGVRVRRNGTRDRTIKLPSDLLKIGYLAGLFDGEGNLQFKTNRHFGRKDSTGCKVAIYSTTPSVLGWLKANVGGSARWDYKRQERRGWKPCGTWEIYRAQDVLVLLKLLLPLLLVKRQQAEKAIKFLADKCGHDSPPAITQSNECK